ncbi:hydroxymethylglutaryl-CoA synthase family protein [Nocardia sp. NBC_01377]|uniref:hydroxymethylglutaryl-CoA synthase family protein n=1 Tax=Nocardia sp. NBC_01377 TaxID=2903595 RepID=UPI0032488A19
MTRTVGIEALNVFTGTCYVDVDKLAEHRGLDNARFRNLLMKEKTVALPDEDPITYGMTAAKPLIDALSPAERNKIELVITATESAFDFSKSMSAYFHDLLGLKRNCRLLEVKNACYSGVAALQMAANMVLSQTSPGAKALVIATDIARLAFAEGGQTLSHDWSFAEPTGGAGAVAMLISDTPHVFQIDVGASGYYGHEVMDTCRPLPDREAGNAELSLLSYLDCSENAFAAYQERVRNIEFAKSFDYLAFHTPFAGMVKGAHRNLMRKTTKTSAEDIETDFRRRMHPGLRYCRRVGNVMGATTLLALTSTIDHAELRGPARIGCFSYGSGCCSEFFSGVIRPESQTRVRAFDIARQLDARCELSLPEYEMLFTGAHHVKFGTRDFVPDQSIVPRSRIALDTKRLVLKRITEFHREYEWIS